MNIIRLLFVVVAIVALPFGAKAQSEVDLRRADRLNQRVIQLYSQGRYADAVPLATQALAIREKALGADHPDVANSINNLAQLYQSQGLYAEAEPLRKRDLAISEKALGADHPDVATRLNNLARLYQAQGRYAEAEPLRKRALEIREKALGADHLDVAQSLNNLASVYDSQGRYAEAQPLQKRALAIRERALGADHPDVADSLNYLAGVYDSQGRYTEAEALLKRALAIREKALGADHPDVASSLDNLAAVYYAQVRDLEAEPLHKRALAIREKALGADHPDVADSLSYLAGVHHAQGRYTEAEPAYKRALAINEKALGADHPEAANSLSNLAQVYKAQGRYAEAEPAYKRALAINEKALGADHRNVAHTISNLAILYRVQGRYAEAEPLHKRALAIKEEALGADHPDVATSINNLAQVYQSQGRYAEAEPLLERALAINEKAFGKDRPNIPSSLNNLAALYHSQGRDTEAEPLIKRALAIREKALGPDHPDVATSLNSLALVYGAQSRFAEAEPPYRRALAINEKALGPNHPTVATSLNNLAGHYQDRGNLVDAHSASTRAVEIMERHLSDGASQRSGGGASERRRARHYFLDNVAVTDALAAKDRNRRDAAEPTFRVAQLAQVSGAGEAVAGMAARFAAGSDALAVAVRDRQDLADRWQRLDAAVIKAVSRPPAERNAAEETRLRAALDETGKRLDALDARITKDFPQYAELSAPKPITADAARGLLAPDEALLVYLVDANRTWLWALRGDKIELHRIEIGADELKGEVQALRERLDPALNTRGMPFPATRAYELHQKVLAPATALLAGARQVFIVPDGALESLPIGVLVTKPPKDDPQDPKDHRDVAWFARDHAITVLPTVGSLRALRQFATTARASKPFLGVGNPVLTGPAKPDPTAPVPEASFTFSPGPSPAADRARGIALRAASTFFRGALADPARVRELDPLPETADELRAIAARVGAQDDDLLLAERAREPTVRAAGLTDYRVLHFATHGLVTGELTGLAEPALVLTPPHEASPEDDGLLTASKIATLKLNADWVVLSACNTAAGDGTPGAGSLSGLARAFFYAGAKSLLVSHWQVPSLATVKLITGTFDALTADPGIGRSEALRRSMMAMMDPTNPPEFAHPLAWAPFVLAGEGGAGR